LTLKRIVILVGVLLGVLLLAAGGALTWLLTADLKPFIENYASESLDRRVSIGSLKIGWGNPISIEIVDLKVANASWGSVPDMISVDGISALLDPWSIPGGVLAFPRLRAVKPVIVLERNRDDTGNWEFTTSPPVVAGTPAASNERDALFPTLLDFEMKDGLLTYRGLGPYRLRLDMSHVTIRSAGEDQPANLAAEGAYNGSAVTLAGTTESFRAFRQASRPFGVDLSLAAVAATLNFKGTIKDPLNFEGVDGPIAVKAAKMGDLLKVLGADVATNPPLALEGTFKHGGDHWEVTKAKGKIAASDFTGDLLLDEGPRGKPDNLTLRLRFAALELNPILPAPAKASPAKSDFTAIPLRLDPNPGVTIDATLDAKQLSYARTRIDDLGLHLLLLPGVARVDRLNLAFAGGRIDASLSADTSAGGPHVRARGLLAGADAAQLAGLVDALRGKLTGRLDGAFDMDMTGTTMGGALKQGRGHAVLGMVQGSVSRDLMEKLSTNLLNLFRNGTGVVPVACLLGVVDMKGGVAGLSPLRLRSTSGTLIGGGRVDILGKSLDITIQSESSTTGFFALDIPIRISGPFANPSINPQLGGGAASRRVVVARSLMGDLSPELRGLAERNPCLK
jgi:uncharacterized protein involved in outer membrane biogenesis